MKNQGMQRTLFVVLGLMLSFQLPAGWDDYKPKSLEATINENAEIMGSADFNYTPGLPQLVTATYIGEKRHISEDRENVLRGWVTFIGQSPEIADLFLTEISFEENGKLHWLPVQKPLIPYFEKELKNRDKVNLYIVWIGTTKSDWVFVVNEFSRISQ